MALIPASGYGSQYANDLSKQYSSSQANYTNAVTGKASIAYPDVSTLGLSTSNLTKGGSNFSGLPSGGNAFNDTIKAESDQNNIDKEGINNQYDEVNDAYRGQLGQLDTSLNRSVGLLKDALSGVQNEVGRSKQTAQQGFEDSVGQASDTAQSVQRKNRNVLRALGILGSTAAGEMLSAPMNEFDKQRATLQQALNTRVAQLDDFLNQKTNEHANQISELTDKYASMKDQIMSDIRYNEKERKNALKGLDAALRSRVSDIRNMQMQYENEVSMRKADLISQWGNVSPYENPTADMYAINNATVNPGLSGSKGNQASIKDRKQADIYGYMVDPKMYNGNLQ